MYFLCNKLFCEKGGTYFAGKQKNRHFKKWTLKIKSGTIKQI